MGLFGNRLSGLRTQNQSVMSPAEAFAAITLVSVGVDGYFSDEEVSTLISSLTRMHMFRSYSADVLRRMFDKLLGTAQREGFGSLLQTAIASLPHELGETVFAVATDLVLADGEVTREEENLLNSLYTALGISEATAIKIIDVMMIKNRG
jgi:tellurite resistance protein